MDEKVIMIQESMIETSFPHKTINKPFSTSNKEGNKAESINVVSLFGMPLIEILNDDIREMNHQDQDQQYKHDQLHQYPHRYQHRHDRDHQKLIPLPFTSTSEADSADSDYVGHYILLVGLNFAFILSLIVNLMTRSFINYSYFPF